MRSPINIISCISRLDVQMFYSAKRRNGASATHVFPA